MNNQKLFGMIAKNSLIDSKAPDKVFFSSRIFVFIKQLGIVLFSLLNVRPPNKTHVFSFYLLLYFKKIHSTNTQPDEKLINTYLI